MRLIAEGGMSEVYEAIHIGLKKRVALKALSPQLAEDADARARFIAEAEFASRIHHPHVVDVTDVGIVDGLPYLVMELLHGENLRSLYARKQRLPYRDLIDLLLPIAAAVAAGHEQRVLHRDLKPENIFLHRVGRRLHPKLLDFGVSSMLNTRGAASGSAIAGTTHYMSPEQARGEAHLDARTDQYALGVILYEGLTGRLPSATQGGAEPRSVELAPSDPPAAALDLPAELEAAIMRAMAREPNQRFASMRAFALALVPFANEPAREYWGLELADRPAEDLQMDAEPDDPPPLAQSRGHAGAGRHEDTVVLLSTPRRRRSSSWWQVAIAALLAAVLPWMLVKIERLSRSRLMPPEASDGFDVDVSVTPATATLQLDGKRVGVGHYAGRLPKDGSLHELRVSADGFATHKVGFRNGPPPSRVSLIAAPAMVDDMEDPLPLVEAHVPRMPTRRASASARVGAHARAKTAEAATTPALPAKLALAPVSISSPTASDHAVPAEDPSSSLPEAAAKVVGEHQPRIRMIDEPLPQVQVIE